MSRARVWVICLIKSHDARSCSISSVDRFASFALRHVCTMSGVSLNAFLVGVDAARAGNGDFLTFVETVLAKNDVTTIEQLAEVTAETMSYDGLGSVSAGWLHALAAA